jgi:hypothetical protein
MYIFLIGWSKDYKQKVFLIGSSKDYKTKEKKVLTNRLT